jgi:hypothetical protein
MIHIATLIQNSLDTNKGETSAVAVVGAVVGVVVVAVLLVVVLDAYQLCII